ncbi:ethylene-responsive transcription factor ERF071-like [Aegilops tauschii subsp. strangulata]|uniref:ethylene-responsive transcription factor ERF071-like n=1 Tax=Aegilops tauschii subsp. strangulata TaxID=200361 RepID=UPI00098AD0D7|nr:ethylene-responsive transcription factor ERF071-like [Aegilops tauschii subsp. strangulata]
MPLKKDPKSKTSLISVRARPSGNFNVELYDECRRFWLVTYPTVDEAAHAYEVAAWRAGRPRMELNFPEIETWAAAEREFYWKHEAEQKKKGVKNEDVADPSTAVPVESELGDWGDSEEGEGCDDPDKDEF